MHRVLTMVLQQQLSCRLIKQKNLALPHCAELRRTLQRVWNLQLWGRAQYQQVKKALQKAGWKVQDLDLIEANEAFAAQAVVVNKEMGWDVSKVNVNGGAIAIGHPIGASGARIFTTLIYEMIKRNAKKGIATLCIGGGQGVAVTVER